MNSQSKGQSNSPANDERLNSLKAETRKTWNQVQRDAVTELIDLATKAGNNKLLKFYSAVDYLVSNYNWASQLPGQLTLVLDNTVIQDFKHRGTAADKSGERQIHALAFIAFSRFVQHWSPRPSRLAISPVAVYEHVGRCALGDVDTTVAVMTELTALLRPTNLPVDFLGVRSAADLVAASNAIDHDARILFDAANSIATKNWQRNLVAPIGFYIPRSIADSEAPRDLPLRYFNPETVGWVLGSRIEQEIIRQSAPHSVERPISSGPIGERLSVLNGVNHHLRKGKVQGLGDLELLQFCTLRAQHKRPSSHVYVAQTFDGGLRNLLMDFSGLEESRSFVGGGGDKEASAMADFMLGITRSFQEEDRRLDAMQPIYLSFLLALGDACIEAEKQLTSCLKPIP